MTTPIRHNKVGTGSDRMYCTQITDDNSCAIQLSVGAMDHSRQEVVIVTGGVAQSAWHAEMIISNMDNL